MSILFYFHYNDELLKIMQGIWVKVHYTPQKIVITKMKILHLVFLVHVDITSWIILFISSILH
jgi:hypothetical protein